MQGLVEMIAGLWLLVCRGWGKRGQRDGGEESENPLSIFQRRDGRTGSVEEASRQQGGVAARRETERQRQREMSLLTGVPVLLAEFLLSIHADHRLDPLSRKKV